jgi:hypothetical protein
MSLPIVAPLTESFRTMVFHNLNKIPTFHLTQNIRALEICHNNFILTFKNNLM